jgi:hypothetical protein
MKLWFNTVTDFRWTGICSWTSPVRFMRRDDFEFFFRQLAFNAKVSATIKMVEKELMMFSSIHFSFSPLQFTLFSTWVLIYCILGKKNEYVKEHI